MIGNNVQPTDNASSFAKSTVSEKVYFETSGANNISGGGEQTCPKCGYPISPSMNYCPNCDTPLHAGVPPVQAPQPAPAQARPHVHPQPTPQGQKFSTVMGAPIMAAVGNFCTLRPIEWQGETVKYNPVTYSGDAILLNRANTDANNPTITSKEQAILSCEDGEWYIENRSELRSTYIRVNGKIRLQKGDIIILGNREFEFNA